LELLQLAILAVTVELALRRLLQALQLLELVAVVVVRKAQTFLPAALAAVVQVVANHLGPELKTEL
jgi:hypothetical protein